VRTDSPNCFNLNMMNMNWDYFFYNFQLPTQQIPLDSRYLLFAIKTI
jgi:hypothetical protein